MNAWKDYYEILGVSQSADQKEIRKAYTEWSFIYHPDRMANLSDSARKKGEEKLKEVNEAYEILSNPDKRRAYDSEWLQRNAGARRSQQSNGSTVIKPRPRVEPSSISFNHITPGTVSHGSFIVYNDGGPFNNFYVNYPDPRPSWIRVVGAKSIGSEQFPLEVEIEVDGQDWGTTHSAVLKVRMDDQETEVKIWLQMKSEAWKDTVPPTSSGYQSGRRRTKTSSRPTPPNYQTAPKNQGTFSNKRAALRSYVIGIIGTILLFLALHAITKTTPLRKVDEAKKVELRKVIDKYNTEAEHIIASAIASAKTDEAKKVELRKETDAKHVTASAPADTITDQNGNVYKTVKIGNQWWMAENLKTTKYNDGTSIPVTDPTWKKQTIPARWYGLKTPAYCWYKNDSSTYGSVYGALYNWYAVNTGKLCPTGWHVPSDAEWTALIDYLGGKSVAGYKLKETGTKHWRRPNTGATNESGFTALPGGARDCGRLLNDREFRYIRSLGHWWSSTEYAPEYPEYNRIKAWYLYIDYSGHVGRNYHYKSDGFSVRCVKDD